MTTSLYSPDFHIDNWDQLPYRELIDLKGILETGLASPFWNTYRQIVQGQAKGHESAILFPQAQPGLDLAFITEYLRGKLQALGVAIASPQTLLDEVSAHISTLQAQENPDERRTPSEQPSASGADPERLDPDFSP